MIGLGRPLELGGLFAGHAFFPRGKQHECARCGLRVPDVRASELTPCTGEPLVWLEPEDGPEMQYAAHTVDPRGFVEQLSPPLPLAEAYAVARQWIPNERVRVKDHPYRSRLP